MKKTSTFQNGLIWFGAGVSLAESGIAPAQVAALAKLLATDAISSNQAHEVFEAMAQTGDDPNKIVDERGMRQVSDAGALQPIVDEVLANCADQAQQYRDGNQKVIGFLVGQCMKASRGKGNPKLFNELLRTSLPGFVTTRPFGSGGLNGIE